MIRYLKIESYIVRNQDYERFTKAAKFKPINEKDLYIPLQYCTHFGCGKLLTLPEKLCGCRCIDHMKKKEFMFYGNY